MRISDCGLQIEILSLPASQDLMTYESDVIHHLLRLVSNLQYEIRNLQSYRAPLPKRTTGNVRNSILRSSSSDQLSM